jgi:hypothetical protein
LRSRWVTHVMVCMVDVQHHVDPLWGMQKRGLQPVGMTCSMVCALPARFVWPRVLLPRPSNGTGSVLHDADVYHAAGSGCSCPLSSWQCET